ncbi:MAG: ATP-binding domain-containing protein, partial [Anaerolineae bacterium]|nr:ATP-binding domain-containing protein [Anaerolineae bacterium]
RGADYRNVQRIQKDFPELKTIPLNENYRSHQLILDAAMSVIRKDPGHIRRNLVSKRTQGPLIEVHELYTDNAEGTFIIEKIKRLMDEEGYNPRDFAIMYRTNAQSRLIEESFIQARMPYRIVGGIRFYERREIKDMMAYLRLINNPNDALALERIISVPPRGIGQKTYQAFVTWARTLPDGQEEAFRELVNGRTPFSGKAGSALREFAELMVKWIALRDSDEHRLGDLFDAILADTDYENYLGDKRKEEDAARIENVYELRRVITDYEGMSLGAMLESLALVSDLDQVDDSEEAPVLLTLHSAKGLEFPVVFLVGLEEKLLPHERSLLEAHQLAEERRLFYVGITRAKERLYITHALTRRSYFAADYTEPSRFLDDLPADITVRHSPMQATRDSQRAYREMRWATALESLRDYQPPEPRFYQGAVVSHPTFGRGIVISSKVRSDIEEVQVKFDTAGLKRLDGEFLKLE